jgi:hypothetical protein
MPEMACDVMAVLGMLFERQSKAVPGRWGGFLMYATSPSTAQDQFMHTIVRRHTMSERTSTRLALPKEGRLNSAALAEQADLINAIAGEFMGGHKKRVRVYTWVPLPWGRCK